jgi:quinol-cytochrome oxidoreductase complex cytochrome b subunit
MSFPAIVSRWFKARCSSDFFGRLLAEKTVPVRGLGLKYYLGGALIFLISLQVLTGILLSIHYTPTVDRAFQSVELLVTQVEYGWFIRSLHKWTSNLIILFACLHLITVFWSGAYRAPRELTWISGLVLFGAVLAVCFFGYLLPWNDISYSATSIAMQLIKKVPFAGSAIVNVLQGGSEFTPRLLTVFYVFHIILLPLVLLGFILFHVYLIQAHGMHEPQAGNVLPGKKNNRPMLFYPDFLKRILLFWVVLLNAMVLLALFFPPELGEAADRFAQTPAGMKSEWPFLFLYQTLKTLPARVLFLDGEIIALGLVFFAALYLLAIPFLSGETEASRRSKLVRGGVLLFFIYVLLMGIWGYVSKPMP